MGQSNDVVIQATVAAITPATATTPGSLTLTVAGQTLVLPLPSGTVLPPGVVAGSMITLRLRFGPAAGTGGTDPEDEDLVDDTTDEDDTVDTTDDDEEDTDD